MTIAIHTTKPMGEISPRARRAAGARPSLSFLIRLRFQILGALIVAVILPALLATRLDPWWDIGSSMMNTAIGTLIAVIVGAFVVQRMSSYPGIRSLSFILSSFMLTYGAVIIFFIMTRLYYSRAQLVMSYVFVVALFFAVSVARRRMQPPRLLLLPFGAALRLLELGGVDWIVAQSEEQLVLPMEGHWPQATPGVAENWQLHERAEPDLPRAVSAVVADLRADLPDHWERFIARCALDGIPVYHCKDISESITGSVEIEHLSENTFGSLLPNSAYLRAKSILDTVAAIVLLPSVVLVCAIAAIAIKLDDGGPVFFQQKRTGLPRRDVLDVEAANDERAAGNRIAVHVGSGPAHHQGGAVSQEVPD